MTTPTIATTPTIDTTPSAQEVAVPPTAGDTSRSLGITSLVLAIASIAFGYTLIVPIAAIVVGSIGLNFSTWGIIVGAVSLALPVLALAFGLAFLAPLGAFAAFFGQ
jgi:hypothetical protein